MVIAAQRLGEDITNPGKLEHGAARAARNDTGTSRGRTDQDLRTAELADRIVRKRGPTHRNGFKVALGGIAGLADSFRHFSSLAEPVAYTALAVADDNQCTKAKATATLNHFRVTADVDHAFFEFRLCPDILAVIAALAATTTIPAASAFCTFFCHRRKLLEYA